MGAYPTHLTNILDNVDLNAAEIVGAFKVLFGKDADTFKAVLAQYAHRAGIKATTTTQVNFAATALTKRPIILTDEGGRVAILTALPTALTISGASGTKYVYADLGIPDADGLSAVTLAQSTTAPASETTASRVFVAQVEWNGTAITAISSAYPIYGETDRQTFYYVGSAEPSPAFEGDLWYDTTNNLLKTHNGTAFAMLLGGKGLREVEIIRKTADETVNNSTTLQPDNELLAALAANERVYFEAWLMHIGNGTADIKFAFTVPSGAVFLWAEPNASVASGITLQQNPGESTSGTSMSFNATTTELINLLTGFVINGATAGNLQLTWAQLVATVVDTKVRASSLLRIWRL